MQKIIRIGTRESQLALWQANTVKNLLEQQGHAVELVTIKSDGDIDLVTPLYEIGVQGIFTKSLDIALLNDKIDVAVHSMKDVPTQLPNGIIQAAVLERGPVKDLLVYKDNMDFLCDPHYTANIATSSIRRKAQWLRRYPQHQMHNLRGNVNTRLQKLANENWDAAIFATAGLERIGVRPSTSIELDWMLPAPAQGAIMVVCKDHDDAIKQAIAPLNHLATALCTRIERDFLRTLMGGCTTPISAYATMDGESIHFEGSLCSLDGTEFFGVEKVVPLTDAPAVGIEAAQEILAQGGDAIIAAIKNAQ